MGAILPRDDKDYPEADLPADSRTVANDPLGHTIGGVYSPYVSFTKQEDGDVANPEGEKFLGPAGRVKIDLTFIAKNDIHDVSTRKGQDTWNFSNPDAANTGGVQALKDVVRTSEVIIRGRIPAKAVEKM